MKKVICLLASCLLFISACSSSEQTTQDQEKKEPDIYVFDDVNKTDTTKQIQPPIKEVSDIQKTEIKNEVPAQPVQMFTVQLGAFSTKERAENFVNQNQPKTSLPLSIGFNESTKYFVVQVPPYKSKEEADVIRDNLKRMLPFKDAFTTPVIKP